MQSAKFKWRRPYTVISVFEKQCGFEIGENSRCSSTVYNCNKIRGALQNASLRTLASIGTRRVKQEHT